METRGNAVEQGLTQFAQRHSSLLGQWGFEVGSQAVEDHGVVSAIHISRLLEALQEQRPAGDFDEAIKAVAHHNPPCHPIEFSKEPLSVLLVLCDEIQEWERPWLDLERAGLALSAVAIHGPAAQDRWHEPLASVWACIRTRLRGKRPQFKSERSILEFALRYGPDIHRSDNIFRVWLGRGWNLQRLGMKGAGWDVRFRLESGVQPPAALPRRKPILPQMERLRCLIQEKRLYGLSKWLPDRAGIRKTPTMMARHAVEYEHDGRRGKETVVLNVGALGRDRPILGGKGGMDDFWKAAGEWSRAWEGCESPV
jgi:hypothetical protein